MQILGKTHQVIGLALGDPYSWKSILLLIKGRLKPVARTWNSTIVRPFMFIPGQRYPAIRKLNYWLNAVVLYFYISLFRPRNSKLLWFFEPLYGPLFLNVFFGWETLYDCVDYFSARGHEWTNDEQVLITRCTHMTVNSHTLYRIHKHRRPDIKEVPLGFAGQLFPKKIGHDTGQKLHNPLTIGYIGSFSYRLDFRLLQKVILGLPNDTFLFAGTTVTGLYHDETGLLKKIQTIRALPNTRWAGKVTKEQIPDLIKSLDICLIPYDQGYDFNRYCFPMKLMEYFSLGKPVISTPIEELNKYSDLISLAGDAKGFISAIQNINTNGWPAEKQQKEKETAQSQSWDKKVSKILRIIS
jgi:glycosyltransferase involved in cell wall biosynthesis